MLIPLLLFTTLTSHVDSLSLLVLHPVYAGSHVLTLQSVVTRLLEQGHHVTTIRYLDTHNLALPTHPNHTHIHRALDNSNNTYPYLTQEIRAKFELPLDLLWSRGLSFTSILKVLNAWRVMDGYCDDLLGDSTLRNGLVSSHFDVALVDLIYNECGLALAASLDLPSVGYWAFSFSSGEQEFTTAPAPASYVPTFMSGLSHDMSLQERCVNTLMKIYGYMFMKGNDWYQTGLIKKYFPSSPSSQDLLSDLSGVLINSDFVLDYPRPLPPTFINVGGLQIQPTPSPLPPNLQSWLDDSGPHGVVLFTMGFIFNPKIVPKDRIDALMSAFARLKQRVIVKFDSAHLDSVPSNVMVVPWVPQQAVLAHPNTKLFFTHCGMHGVLEAIHFGVPMVGMPVFIDQGDVLVRMKERGIAEGLDKFATSDEMFTAMETVLNDPGYKRNVMALSKVARARRSPPMEDALWLLKHVAETKGAEHLKLASRKLSLFQYYCLDCLLCLVVISFTLWWFTIRIINLTFKFIRRKKEKVN